MNFNQEPRGFRNNNPGNIRHGNEWLGLSGEQTDVHFDQFQSVEYGIRAMLKILETYRQKYHLHTVEEIISRWAPPNENNTAAYIESVCRSIDAAQPLRWVSAIAPLPAIVAGIIHHENGRQPFNLKFIQQCNTDSQ